MLRKQRANKKALSEQLREWCEQFGPGAITHLQKQTGLTFATIARIRDGKAAATPATAKLIEKHTNGRVSAAALLGVAA